MPKVTIDLPKEVFSARDASPEEFVRDLRLAAAIYWYQKSEISQEKAATIAGLNRRDFFEALARERVDVFVVDFDAKVSEKTDCVAETKLTIFGELFIRMF